MHQIDSSAIRGADINGHVIKPKALNAVCPHCRTKVTFSLGGYSQPGPLNSISATGRCPECIKPVGVWALNPDCGSTTKLAQVFLHPDPTNYIPHPADIGALPDPLRRAFLATIDAFNAGNYAATAVSGRRTLEGIFKVILSRDAGRKSLNELIKLASQEIDLAAPLTKLAHAVRDGGNLGAHFDMENEPDEQVAKQIVELVDYLISYLYVLPRRIEALEDTLNSKPITPLAPGRNRDSLWT